MKNGRSLSSLFCIILAVIFAVGSTTNISAQTDPVSSLRTAISLFRNVAAELRQEASHCRSFLASHPRGSTCTPSYTNCQQKYVTVSADQADAIAAVLDKHAETLTQRLPELVRKQNKVLSDQRAIYNLGFETTADQIIAWQKVSVDSRAALMKASLSAILDSAFMAVGKLVSIAYKPEAARDLLTELKTPVTVAELRRIGIESKGLADLVVKLNTPSSNKATGQLLELLISKLGKIKSFVALGNVKQNEVPLKILKMFLGWMIKASSLKFLLIELEWTTAAVYNFTAQWISASQIKKLTELTETELRSLKRLHDMLEADVKLLLSEINTLPACPAI